MSLTTVGTLYLLTARANSPKEKLHQIFTNTNPTSVTTNYHLFGQNMPGRTFGAYRYGFNGKETYIKDEFDVYDYGARIYNEQIARWMTTDPMTDEFPALSPYNFVNNSPTLFTDLDGEVITLPAGMTLTAQRAILSNFQTILSGIPNKNYNLTLQLTPQLNGSVRIEFAVTKQAQRFVADVNKQMSSLDPVEKANFGDDVLEQFELASMILSNQNHDVGLGQTGLGTTGSVVTYNRDNNSFTFNQNLYDMPLNNNDRTDMQIQNQRDVQAAKDLHRILLTTPGDNHAADIIKQRQTNVRAEQSARLKKAKSLGIQKMKKDARAQHGVRHKKGSISGIPKQKVSKKKAGTKNTRTKRRWKPVFKRNWQGKLVRRWRYTK